MEDVEIPKYFMCPISLQMMRDPVTAATGITYDRESIEKWLSEHGATCPVTNQPLPYDDQLVITPNHTLRRLIQGWCVSVGVDRIPTPRPALDRRRCLALARKVRVSGERSAMGEIESLARESERNRMLLEEGGVVEALAALVVRRFREGETSGVEDALRALNRAWVPRSGEIFDGEFFDALGWALRVVEGAEAVKALRLAVGTARGETLERLKLELFMSLTAALRGNAGLKAAGVEAMVGACGWGRNRAKMVEAGAVGEAVEAVLAGGAGVEAGVALLGELSGSAEGRARVVGHAGGIAGLARVLLRVSGAADEGAVRVLARLAGLSARPEVLAEMMAVGAVAKLCMLVQTDCPASLKDKATAVLKRHSKFWAHSPCVAHFLTSSPSNKSS